MEKAKAFMMVEGEKQVIKTTEFVSLLGGGMGDGGQWDHGLGAAANFDTVKKRASETLLALSKEQIKEMEGAKSNALEACLP